MTEKKNVSILLSVPQMIDLAVGSPEVGVVNFNVLHSLLHVLVQQIDLRETKVEFKGNGKARINAALQGGNLDKPIINLTEYVVVPGKQPKKVISKQDRYKKFVGENGNADEIFVEREIRVVDEKDGALATPGKGPKVETVVVVVDAPVGETISVSAQPSQHKLQYLEEEICHLKQEIRLLKSMPSNTDLIKAVRSQTPVIDTVQIFSLTKRIEAAEEGIERLAGLIEDLAKQQPGADVMVGTATKANKKIADGTELEERVSKLEEYMANNETNFNQLKACWDITSNAFCEHVEQLQSQFLDLEKEIGEIIENMKILMAAVDSEATDKVNQDLNNRIVFLEEHFNNVSKQLTDQKDHQETLDVLLEQIQYLKSIKADQEFTEDALADKADTCVVKEKVNQSQFESAYGNLSQTLEQMIEKLETQECMWQQALKDIQQEIEGKMDKLELAPLRDFVQNKLKMLQDKLGSLKSGPEAAGATSKLLRNLHCLSCNTKVVMRKEIDPSSFPPPPSMIAAKSIGPYLTYELDQIRRQRKCFPNGKNLNHFESAVCRDDTGNRDHVCGRYCGGSHTVTKPQQRVPKTGNFVQQWGCDDASAEGEIVGADGQLYKTRELSGVYFLQEKEPKKALVITKDVSTDPPSVASKFTVKN